MRCTALTHHVLVVVFSHLVKGTDERRRRIGAGLAVGNACSSRSLRRAQSGPQAQVQPFAFLGFALPGDRTFASRSRS
jgi:hypothetical protein